MNSAGKKLKLSSESINRLYFFTQEEAKKVKLKNRLQAIGQNMKKQPADFDTTQGSQPGVFENRY